MRKNNSNTIVLIFICTFVLDLLEYFNFNTFPLKTPNEFKKYPA